MEQETFREDKGLRVRAYAGDGAAMLAMDLMDRPESDFAGFAIRSQKDGSSESKYLTNRLSLSNAITSETAPAQRVWTPSNVAPFQKFRWIDFPQDGSYKYTVTTMHFSKQKRRLVEGQSLDVALTLGQFRRGTFRMGFTRGYLSSQAYNARVRDDWGGDPNLRPDNKKSLDVPSDTFLDKWNWLGAEGSAMVFDFLAEARANKRKLDVFAYDLDEPRIVIALGDFGPDLRLFLDDAKLHTGPSALEPQAFALIGARVPAANLRRGHFRRFAHNKVMIQRDAATGRALKVLTGSANFSVRGLYVQSNNVLIFDNPDVAGLYGKAFDVAFTDPAKFSQNEISQQWFDVEQKPLPTFSVAFSPHKDAATSLSMVAKRIKEAQSSVMFAVMELGGGGDVLSQLRSLSQRSIFSYGVTQSDGDLKLYKAGTADGLVVPFAYLHKQVPAPFQAEYSGGMGQVIHHKFVVVDFNGAHPSLFTGSSNLADGGEESNGDNLLAFYDPEIVSAYAVEAVRLIDHYHFRVAMQNATTPAKALMLDDGSKPKNRWWKPYWDESNIKFKERKLFAKNPDTGKF